MVIDARTYAQVIEHDHVDRAVELLIAILPNWAALVALGRIGGAWALEPLLAALEGKELIDREAAARALGRIGDKRALEPLQAALARADQTKDVRKAAEEAIAALTQTNYVQTGGFCPPQELGEHHVALRTARYR